PHGGPDHHLFGDEGFIGAGGRSVFFLWLNVEFFGTREEYGVAIAKLGEAEPRVVALDADVKNSTFSDKFEKALPDRFYENFIAEQVMIGAAMGLAARGAIPFPSTFACFLSRAYDFIRMAAISNVSIKMAGSH